MLSSVSAISLSSVYIKFILEVVMDDFGYTYVNKEGEVGSIHLNSHSDRGPNLPAFGRVCYEIFSVTPYSRIVNAVSPGKDSEEMSALEILRQYLYTQDFFAAVQALPSNISQDNRAYTVRQAQMDILDVRDIICPSNEFKEQANKAIDFVFSRVNEKLSLISPTCNVFQLCAGLSQIRLGLRRSAIGKRQKNGKGSNLVVFRTNPGLTQALENDFREWLSKKMNFDIDRTDTVIMTKVMGQYINQYFLPYWFKERIKIHTAGATTFVQGGETYEVVDQLTVPVVNYVDVNIVDILQRLGRVSQVLFQHAKTGSKVDSFYYSLTPEEQKQLGGKPPVSRSQYTVLEYYVSVRLSGAMKQLNSDYYSVTRGTKHTVSGPIRRKVPSKFIFNSDYATNRLSNIPRIDVSNEFRTRMRLSRATLNVVNQYRKFMNTDDLEASIHQLASKIMDTEPDSHDSDYNYLRYNQMHVKTVGESREYADMPDLLIGDYAYSKIEDIIRCLCDLDMLNNALGKYGLSIIDMITGDVLEDASLKNITCFDDLLSRIYQGMPTRQTLYADMYKDGWDVPEDLRVTQWVPGFDDTELEERFLKDLPQTSLPEIKTLRDTPQLGVGEIISLTPTQVATQNEQEIQQLLTFGPNSLISKMGPAAAEIDLFKLSTFFRAFVGVGCDPDHSDLEYIINPQLTQIYTEDDHGNSVLDYQSIRDSFASIENDIVAQSILDFMSWGEYSPIVRLYSAAYAYQYNTKFFLEDTVAEIGGRNLSRICNSMTDGIDQRLNDYLELLSGDFLGSLNTACSPFASKAEVYLKSSQYGQTIRYQWNSKLSGDDLVNYTPDLSWGSFLTLGVFGIRKLYADANSKGQTLTEYSLVPYVEGKPDPTYVYSIQCNPGYINASYFEQPQNMYWFGTYPLAPENTREYVNMQPFKDGIRAIMGSGRDKIVDLLEKFYKVYFIGTTKRLLMELFTTPANPNGDLQYWYILQSPAAQADFIMTYNSMHNELRRLFNLAYATVKPHISRYTQIIRFADSVATKNTTYSRKSANPESVVSFDKERLMHLDSLGTQLAPLNAFFEGIEQLRRYKGMHNYSQVTKLLSSMGVHVYENISKVGALEDPAYCEFMAEVLIAIAESFVDVEMREVKAALTLYAQHREEIHRRVQDMTGVSSINLLKRMEYADVFNVYADKLLAFANTDKFKQACLAYRMNTLAMNQFRIFASNKITQTWQSDYSCHDPYLRYSTGQHVFAERGDWVVFPHEDGVFVGINVNQSEPAIFSYTDIMQQRLEMMM